MRDNRVAVVIPCYRVGEHIFDVLSRIGPEVHRVYVVDDACPQQSGKRVQEKVDDPRVTVLFNTSNLGVGGAVKRGFEQAAADGNDLLVKVDGDGQMAPEDIPKLLKPLQDGVADYVKGNRYFSPHALRGMPPVRVFGNGILSFFCKLSSGYWQLMDPNNGFLAIHARVFAALEPERVDNGFFFESDMLCRLHTLGAVVRDVPLPARYGDETSNLRIASVVWPFVGKHIARTFRRIVYDYFVRDFNVGSAQLLSGALALGFGLVYGARHWIQGILTGVPTGTGPIMVAVLPTIVGVQLLLSALNYDIANRFTSPIHPYL